MKVTTSNGEFPGKPLEGNMEYAKLYHYTSLKNFKEIWKSKTLLFGDINKLNDLDESIKLYTLPLLHASTNREVYIKNGEIINNCINSFKQISLTKDYDSYVKGSMSPMMWGHYGDRAQGVCLELDFDKIVFPNNTYYKSVRYKELISNHIQMPSFNDIDTEKVNDFIVEHLNEIFFIKSKEWSGENEFRIISNKNSFLSIQDAISNVYVTKCNNDTCFEVERIINDELPVKFMLNSQLSFRLYELHETKSYRENPKNNLAPNQITLP